jgi:hypothetical protein
MVSAIALNSSYTKHGEAKTTTYHINGDRVCEVSNQTFDALIPNRIHHQLPCTIVRIKDIKGRIHYFDGLSSISVPGRFKLGEKLKRCCTMQTYRFSHAFYDAAGRIHNIFMLKESETYYAMCAEKFLKEENADIFRARKYLEKALKINPSDDFAFVLLGELHMLYLNYDVAEMHFNNALIINPANERAKENLCSIALNREMMALEADIDSLSIEEEEEEHAEEKVAPAPAPPEQPKVVVADPKPPPPEPLRTEKKPPCSCTLL